MSDMDMVPINLKRSYMVFAGDPGCSYVTEFMRGIVAVAAWPVMGTAAHANWGSALKTFDMCFNSKKAWWGFKI